MRVIVSVKPTPGGGQTSQATRYIAYRERDEEREGKEPRPLFSAGQDGLSFWKAERVLTESRAPTKDELIHIVVSFREEDFQALGEDETKRQDSLKEITRESVSRIADELKTVQLIWAAGIHRNTDNPHIHLLINRNYVDRESGREKRLVRLPEEMLAGREIRETGGEKINQGSFGLAFEAGLDRMQQKARAESLERTESVTNTHSIRSDEIVISSNERPASAEEKLFEAAGRNPSIAGRELIREIILRGPEPAAGERPEASDIRDAFRSRSIDHPGYRTQPEQADWLGQHSRELRDLYVRGAEIKGDVLVIPAEEYELHEDRDQPFITNLSYARQQIQNPEAAIEFHALAKAIAGQSADPKTEIEVFRYYYDRVRQDRGWVISGDRQSHYAEALERTLGEMRSLAGEMAKLEIRESIEITHNVASFEALQEADRADKNDEEELSLTRYEHLAETTLAQTERDEEIGTSNDKEADLESGKFNTSARKISLRDESLRFPASLSFETKERLVTRTLPAIDRLLETGKDRASIHAGIDLAIYNQDSPEYNEEESRKIGGFLKTYVDERLRDPETRALNSSPVFRSAHAKIVAARAPEELNCIAENFLRDNLRRTNAVRLHQAYPDRYPKPEELPLDARERSLLFFGRAPDHHSAEIRELQYSWGLSRVERAGRVEALREGRLAPSATLEKMVEELQLRQTSEALGHYQASIINEEMRNPGKLNLRQMYERMPPYERTYLIQEIEHRKQLIRDKQTPAREALAEAADRTSTETVSRAFGAPPRESSSYREYLASMGAIERCLLNEAVHKRQNRDSKIVLDKETHQLSITEARALLLPEEQVKIRNQARNLAWESISPREVFDPQPDKTMLSDAVAYLQEGPQQRARLAHNALKEFLREKTGLNSKDQNYSTGALSRLALPDAQRLKALEDYAARMREELYRGFESLDSIRRELQRTQNLDSPERHQSIELNPHSKPDRDQISLANGYLGEKDLQLPNGSHFDLDRNSTVNGLLGDPDRESWIVESTRKWHSDSVRDLAEPLPPPTADQSIERDHDFSFDR